MSNSNLCNNTASYGGGIYNDGTAEVHFCRIIGNNASEGTDIYNNSGDIEAQYNWWGDNNDPSSKVFGDVNVTPWLILTVTADPTIVNSGTTSNITADLLHDSNGVYHDPASGHVPDGIPINFTTTLGTITTPLSTFNGTGNSTIDFGNQVGTADVSVEVDNAIVLTNVTLNLLPTVITVNPISGYKGDIIDLTAILKNTSNQPLEGKTVNFSVNGVFVGSAVTNSLGIATYAYTILQNSGTYTILAEFLHDLAYAGTTNTNDLQVPYTPTALVVSPVTGFKGDRVNLIAKLKDTHSNIDLDGKTIQFSVNGNIVGTATTNAQGTATLSYILLKMQELTQY